VSTQGIISSSPVFQPDKEKDAIEYKTAQEKGSLSKDDFMMLFVTQLQYQDPMSPMESAEMASQMAQFNMLDLMYENNEAMNNLAKTYQTSTGLSAVSLIGHTVHHKADSMVLEFQGETRELFLELGSDAADVAIEIRDSSGKLVNILELGSEPEGRAPVQWDGTDINGNPAEPGKYYIRASAIDQHGDEIDSDLWLPGRIEGINYQDDGSPLFRINNGSVIGIEDLLSIS